MRGLQVSLSVLLAACLAQNCPDVDGFYGYQSKIAYGGGDVVYGGPNGVWQFAVNLCGPVIEPNNCRGVKPQASPLWGCQSYGDEGVVMAAGNNNVPPNPNPTPGTWTVLNISDPVGLVFTATGGDASADNPGCFQSMQVVVYCNSTAGNGVQDLQFAAPSACPNTPFTFYAASAAACPAKPPPPAIPFVALPASEASAVSSFNFATQDDCLIFGGRLKAATNCSANVWDCFHPSLAVTLNGACQVPVTVLTPLLPTYYAYVGPTRLTGACPATGALCFDTSANVAVISHADMQSCLADYLELHVVNGTVTEDCGSGKFTVTINGEGQKGALAIVERFAALNFTDFAVVPV